jgi:hypothetical protein
VILDDLLVSSVTTLVAQGYSVKLDTGPTVVLTRTKSVSHIWHLVASIFTVGWWIIVWVILILRKKETTIQLSVLDGQVQQQNLGKSRKN